MRKVRVSDKFQKYTYERTKPIGRGYDTEFRPQLTPKQMLELGVFDGKYFEDCPKELPKSWFAKVKKENFFGVSASQPLEVWQQKRWIHQDDPRGWFQWYCRYYLGRRHEDDARQIKRWKAIVRHVAQVKKHCRGDLSCRRKQRQALLHWAIDSRKL